MEYDEVKALKPHDNPVLILPSDDNLFHVCWLN